MFLTYVVFIDFSSTYEKLSKEYLLENLQLVISVMSFFCHKFIISIRSSIMKFFYFFWLIGVFSKALLKTFEIQVKILDEFRLEKFCGKKPSNSWKLLSVVKKILLSRRSW